VVEKNISDDMIYNWRNELRSNQNGALVVASSQANKYKNQGFSKTEILDISGLSESKLKEIGIV
jgi:hypothetical protein